MSTDDQVAASSQVEAESGEHSPELVMSRSMMAELVKLRKKRKIGQAPIAKAIGMSQAGVSQIENLKRNVSLESVLIYAQAIGAKITIAPDEGPAKKGARRPPSDS